MNNRLGNPEQRAEWFLLTTTMDPFLHESAVRHGLTSAMFDPSNPLTSVHSTDTLLGFIRPAGRCPVHDIILDNLRFATGKKKKRGQL